MKKCIRQDCNKEAIEIDVKDGDKVTSLLCEEHYKKEVEIKSLLSKKYL